MLLLTEIHREEGRGGTWLRQGNFLFAVPSFYGLIGKNPFVILPVNCPEKSFIPVGLQFLVALKQFRLPKIIQHFNFRLLEMGSSVSFLHPGSAMPSQPTLPAIQMWAGKISCLLFICERFVSQFKLHISFQYLFLFFYWHPDNKGPLCLNKFSNLYTCAHLHTHTQACTCIKYCIFSIDTLCAYSNSLMQL